MRLIRRLAAAALFLVAAATASAQPPLGVYVDWGSPNGRESNVEAFETWLGRTGLWALDYGDGSSWANFVATAKWLPGYWWQYDNSRMLVWSIQLTLSGTPLSDIAAGKHDADFAAVASQIAWAQPTAMIRLGWEFNGNWFPWAAAGNTQDYISAFRHVAAIFKAASPTFKIDWCPNVGFAGALPAEQAYPGDDVVDVIGMDIYDKDPTSLTNPAQSWNGYLTGDHGLQWHQAFAAQHGKPMSYPEWGIGQEGDNDYFVTQMGQWIAANNIAYHVYWNTNAAYPGLISTGQYPRAAAAFKTQFAGGGNSPPPPPPPPPAPTATLTANPSTIDFGSSSTLTWSSTGATSCVDSGFNGGNATAGMAVVSPKKTSVYAVSCNGASASATVTVVKCHGHNC